MASWKHLMRFIAKDGQTYFASLSSPEDGAQIDGQSVTAFASFADLQNGKAGQTVSVHQLLAPVPYEGDIVCIGVNYAEHAAEANLTVPIDPVMWYKPRTALGSPGDIAIPKVAADGFLDFEGELTIITSKDALDISVEDATDYVLGYTIGNDLTARAFQDPKRAGGQFTRCKAFDGFAPLGPVLTHKDAFGGVESARVLTKVNGEIFQDAACDLIHGPAKLLSFLSQGTTIPAGTAIMTGSPPGVGWFRTPKYNLQDGDVVEISITSLGTLKNTMVYKK